MEKHIKNNKPHEFELPDGSYLISDIQDYFEYFEKKNMKKILLVHQ